MGTSTGPSYDGHLVVMGVSGSGKTTVGAALGERLAVDFVDADDLHPPANVERMAAGIPLTDADRGPWLASVGEWLAGHPAGAVVACSALRRAYRDQLRGRDHRAEFLHLDVSQEVLAARLGRRRGHFMPATLLSSQLATLECLSPDEPGVSVPADGTAEEVVAACLHALESR